MAGRRAAEPPIELLLSIVDRCTDVALRASPRHFAPNVQSIDIWQ